MIEITDAQLQLWLQSAFWPFVRISGLLMSAPLIGERYAPVRVRIGLGILLLILLLPGMPTANVLAPFSAAWWFAGIGELAIGILMGFLLRLAFEAMMLAGELIGFGMGLGFARLADPVHGTDAPALGLFLRTLSMLLFLSLGGHLRLIEALAASFQTMPGGSVALTGELFHSAALMGRVVFDGALAIALPLIAAMLLVNLAFGVMSRSTPTLNATAVGFPISLFAGMVLLGVTIAPMLGHFQEVLNRLWRAIEALIQSV